MEASSKFPIVLGPREIGAGLDPESGLPCIALDVADFEPGTPNRRYMLHPDAARKLALVLLACDPSVADVVAMPVHAVVHAPPGRQVEVRGLLPHPGDALRSPTGGVLCFGVKAEAIEDYYRNDG